MSGRKVMAQPINVVFNYLQKQVRVVIWLYDNTEFRIECVIIGFDEHFNLCCRDTLLVYEPKKDGSKQQNRPSEDLGRILLKGDNITLIQPVQAS